MTDHSDHNHSEEISTLNTLIATTIDSITGYENSAKDIDNERFAEIFRQRANERQQVVEDLRNEVRRLGGDPEDSGSFLGKTHQRFEDLKAAITGQDEQAVINEVERGGIGRSSTPRNRSGGGASPERRCRAATARRPPRR